MLRSVVSKTRELAQCMRFGYRYKPSRFHEVHGSS